MQEKGSRTSFQLYRRNKTLAFFQVQCGAVFNFWSKTGDVRLSLSLSLQFSKSANSILRNSWEVTLDFFSGISSATPRPNSCAVTSFEQRHLAELVKSHETTARTKKFRQKYAVMAPVLFSFPTSQASHTSSCRVTNWLIMTLGFERFRRTSAFLHRENDEIGGYNVKEKSLYKRLVTWNAISGDKRTCFW